MELQNPFFRILCGPVCFSSLPYHEFLNSKLPGQHTFPIIIKSEMNENLRSLAVAIERKNLYISRPILLHWVLKMLLHAHKIHFIHTFWFFLYMATPGLRKINLNRPKNCLCSVIHQSEHLVFHFYLLISYSNEVRQIFLVNSRKHSHNTHLGLLFILGLIWRQYSPSFKSQILEFPWMQFSKLID